MEKHYSVTREELEEMLSKAALVGATVAAETVDKAHKKEQKDQRDRRLHNTKLLLRNYRMLKENCEHAVFEKEQETCVESEEDVIKNIMLMKGDDKVIVDSIRRSAERTRIIIVHIDKMLEVYRLYCQKNSEKDKRQYKVVRSLYISKQKTSVQDLAKKFGVSKVTIYDDIKAAEEKISALLFGINGLNLFH